MALWTAIAIGLRLYQLGSKPLWTDEMSTLVFSLGHSFRTIPLSQVITVDALLEPLRVDAATGPGDAAMAILASSNHPPLFFVLMHPWLQLTHPAGTYVVPWIARSLSAVIGGLLTPVVYGLMVLIRRASAAPFAAALVAMSPFGIYLSQEARHYTLALIWITASLCCLAEALASMAQGRPLPRRLILLWTVVNGLGLATHYFTTITFLAEVLVLASAGYLWRQRYRSDGLYTMVRQVTCVGLGTMASGLPWFIALLAAPDQGELTQWIYASWQLIDWITPVANTLASAASMVYLLPIQDVSNTIALLSTGVVLAIAFWSLWGRQRWRHAAVSWAALWGLCIASVVVLWGITYGAQISLAQTLRYHFVYFPAFVGVVAVGLAHRWAAPRRYNRALVVVALLVSLAGGLTVIHNLAYQKVHRPDQVVADMAKAATPERPLLLAMSHQSHGQTGRLMAIAWEMMTHSPDLLERAQFFLDPQPCVKTGEQNCGAPSYELQKAVELLEDADVWLLNYGGRPTLRAQGCRYRETERVDGYKYSHYAC
ncbi:MAG: hypothetical protein WBA10_07810 [Elainellaceae cyanobacterium]